MSKAAKFDEPEASSDEEDPIIDEDTCGSFEIENAFKVKYKVAGESAVSLKKVYILCLSADKSFERIAAGLSDNTAQVFNINNGVLSRPIITLNVEGISDIRFMDKEPNHLLIGSKNGFVGIFDLRTGQQEFSFHEPNSDVKKPVTSFDLNANGRILCSGTSQVVGDVYLQFFDIRDRRILGGYWESHQDDVTSLKFHPKNPDLLCTGSTDGLINIFDISESSEDDALLSTINTESSVSALDWHKNVYEKDVISCITHTNDLKTYECEEGDLIAEFDRCKITEAIKRKSVVDCNLISCHNLNDGGIFALATSNFNKGEVVRSVQLQGKNLVPHGMFYGNKQIVRASVHDPKTNLLATAGESGIVTLWSPLSADEPLPNSGGPNKFKAKTKAGKSHGRNPY